MLNKGRRVTTGSRTGFKGALTIMLSGNGGWISLHRVANAPAHRPDCAAVSPDIRCLECLSHIVRRVHAQHRFIICPRRLPQLHTQLRGGIANALAQQSVFRHRETMPDWQWQLKLVAGVADQGYLAGNSGNGSTGLPFFRTSKCRSTRLAAFFPISAIFCPALTLSPSFTSRTRL